MRSVPIRTQEMARMAASANGVLHRVLGGFSRSRQNFVCVFLEPAAPSVRTLMLLHRMYPFSSASSSICLPVRAGSAHVPCRNEEESN